MRNRICKAIVVGATALSVVASALATAEPAAAQWRGEHEGGGSMAIGSRWGPPGEAGASAPYWSDDRSDDSCWEVRPIYSVSGAWLNNRRVNFCH